MLTRRAVLASTAATPFLSYAAFADTPKDVLVMGKQIDDLISLDPAEVFEFSGSEIVDNCYERLIRPNPDKPTEVIGALAESWTVSEDGLTYTFKIKPGRKFASGNPVTAEDAAFSLQRAVKLNKSPAFIITQFGFTKENADARIRATDPATLVLTVAEKQAPSFLFYCLSATVGAVVDKAVTMSHAQGDDLGTGWLKSASAGSGVWVLRSWKPSESVVLEPNPNGPQAPKLKRVLIRHVPDPSAQFLQLKQGDIDIARNLSPDQIKAAVAAPDAFTLSAATRSYIMYLGMNTKNPNLAKPAVRQAIKWALDYDGIQKNIVPTTYKVHQSFVPEGFPGAIDDQPFRRDVAKAKALLAEAGLPDGFEITLDHAATQPTADIAQAIQANLADIGIKVKLISGEGRAVLTKIRARQHEMSISNWGSDYFDPHSNAETFNINTDNGENSRQRTSAWRVSWLDKDLSDRAIAAVKETDQAKRIAEYQSMQRDSQQRSPFAMMLQNIETAVMRKNVHGFVVAPLADTTSYVNTYKT